jgi:predicted dehydrogenase/nucleoside-diphosphate-sugar epimerase
LVGCGAVAKENLMPVLAGHEGIQLGPLVDRDHTRARELADAYGVPTVLTDADELTKDVVDAVVLATPPIHHAPATIACAQKGLHVFVEKPMAITVADAQAMVDATARAGVALSVGLYRRFLPAVQLLRTLVGREEFGAVLSVDAEEGGPYGWQLATLDILRRTSGGGGPLIDLGSHIIDLVLYALNATPTLDCYQDNERGGIETDCILRALLTTPRDSVPFRLELSRTRELRGSILVKCEQATLELLRGDFQRLIVHRPEASSRSADVELSITHATSTPFQGYDAFRQEFDDWLEAIARRTEPVLSGRSVVPVVRLIEEAYQHRTRLPEPWAEPPPETAVVVTSNAARGRVLVTGAGGFLGGRTTELLRDQGWEVLPLVREPKGAARLARWPNDIALGDVCSRSEMDRAMRGCVAVVHCAVGTSWMPAETRRVTVEGTRTVAEAALAAGVSQFVHISTLFVHKRGDGAVIDETTPLEPQPGDDYGQAKLEAERALAEVARRGLSTIILRPTRIYGPFSRTFSISPLLALVQGRLAIGGRGDVPANMVYVDNVVGAIARALDAPATLSGSAFLVNDPEQATLEQFYEYFGRDLGVRPRVVPDRRQPGNSNNREPGLVRRWINGCRTLATSPELRKMVRRVLETDPIGTWPRQWWEGSPGLQRALLRRFGGDTAVTYRKPVENAEELLIYYGEPGRVSVAKAERELGFVASVSREEAMRVTLEWAKYARVLPQTKTKLSQALTI